MLLTEMNVEDLNTLMQFRIERLLHFFASSLPKCLIQIDSGNLLIVHCPNSVVVDDLLNDLEDLCSHAWLILGVPQVAVYFGQEEILCANTCVQAEIYKF
jgi:hypothetical protein